MFSIDEQIDRLAQAVSLHVERRGKDSTPGAALALLERLKDLGTEIGNAKADPEQGQKKRRLERVNQLRQMLVFAYATSKMRRPEEPPAAVAEAEAAAETAAPSPAAEAAPATSANPDAAKARPAGTAATEGRRASRTLHHPRPGPHPKAGRRRRSAAEPTLPADGTESAASNGEPPKTSAPPSAGPATGEKPPDATATCGWMAPLSAGDRLERIARMAEAFLEGRPENRGKETLDFLLNRLSGLKAKLSPSAADDRETAKRLVRVEHLRRRLVFVQAVAKRMGGVQLTLEQLWERLAEQDPAELRAWKEERDEAGGLGEDAEATAALAAVSERLTRSTPQHRPTAKPTAGPSASGAIPAAPTAAKPVWDELCEHVARLRAARHGPDDSVSGGGRRTGAAPGGALRNGLARPLLLVGAFLLVVLMVWHGTPRGDASAPPEAAKPVEISAAADPTRPVILFDRARDARLAARGAPVPGGGGETGSAEAPVGMQVAATIASLKWAADVARQGLQGPRTEEARRLVRTLGRQLAQELAARADREAFLLLLDLAEEEDPYLSAVATQALVLARGPETDQAILDELHRTPDVPLMALWLAGERRLEKSRDLLTAIATDSGVDGRRRCVALGAIAHVGQEDDLPLLVPLLDSKALGEEAGRAVAAIVKRAILAGASRFDLCLPPDSSDGHALDESPRAAASLLIEAAIGDERALEVLTTAARSPDPGARLAAAKALAAYPLPDALDLVRTLAADLDPEVRTEADLVLRDHFRPEDTEAR